MRAMFKRDNREISPIFERPARREDFVQRTENLKDTRMIYSNFLIRRGWGKNGQCLDAFHVIAIPPSGRNLLWAEIIYWITQAFLVDRRPPRISPGRKLELSSQKHGRFPKTKWRHDRPDDARIWSQQWADAGCNISKIRNAIQSTEI